MAVELQEQLLARERELDSWDGVLMATADGLAAFEHAQRWVRMECDGVRD
jgi:hypothetical protein